MKKFTKFLVEANDNRLGAKCAHCKKGKYEESDLQDYMDGTLHCNKCNQKVNHYRSRDKDRPEYNDDSKIFI